MKITDDIRYIGVNDHKIDLFECADGQGINQMGAFMDQIIGKNCKKQSDILPGTFIHGLNSSKYR